MPVPGDYSSQLDQIIKALNHSSTPSWVIAMLSAFLGFLASLVNQVFQQRYGEQRSRNKMRRIIYAEIGANYSRLVHFHDLKGSTSDTKDIEWKKRQLKERFLKFEGETYAEDKKDVLFQLPERSSIRLIYDSIHDVLGPEDEYGFEINSGLAIEIIEDSIRLKDLPAKFAQRYINPSDLAAIAEANRRRLARNEARK
jgi:hypothetical protein